MIVLRAVFISLTILPCNLRYVFLSFEFIKYIVIQTSIYL